jgi:hypothetical protein
MPVQYCSRGGELRRNIHQCIGSSCLRFKSRLVNFGSCLAFEVISNRRGVIVGLQVEQHGARGIVAHRLSPPLVTCMIIKLAPAARHLTINTLLSIVPEASLSTSRGAFIQHGAHHYRFQ